jgi:hypothetical protein
MTKYLKERNITSFATVRIEPIKESKDIQIIFGNDSDIGTDTMPYETKKLGKEGVS